MSKRLPLGADSVSFWPTTTGGTWIPCHVRGRRSQHGPGLCGATSAPQHVLPLEVELTTLDIRGCFTLRSAPPGRALWCASSAACRGVPRRHEPATCPDGCAPVHAPRVRAIRAG